MRSKLVLAGVLLFLGGSSARGQEARVIRLTTPDDVGILGSFHPAPGRPAPAVLLLHGAGQSRQEWNTFASLLQSNGLNALAIDLRGHGQSTRQLTADGPRTLEFRSFRPDDFQDMLMDVNRAFDWLAEQPGVNRSRIALVGANLGANLAVKYATFNEDLAAVALLSPTISYRDLRTDDAMKKMGRIPVRIYVSEGDAFAYESCKRLMAIREEAGISRSSQELMVSSGLFNGVAMLAGVRRMPELLLGWLRELLLGITAPVEESPPTPGTAAPSRDRPPPSQPPPATRGR